MWSQILIEALRFVASIATPVTIAVFGVLINRTIQRQNAITQRKSSWLEKWADDFLKAASAFNESAKDFMWLYLEPEWEAMRNLPGALEKPKLQKEEIHKASLALNRGWVDISMFAGFAPTNGKALTKAASDLLKETKSWIDSGMDNEREFLQKQFTFNNNARKVHAELLGVKESED
jgi:hypothetical protein